MGLPGIIWRLLAIAIVLGISFGLQPNVKAQLACGSKSYRYPYLGCGGTGGGAGPPPPPPSCSNILDLTQTCNDILYFFR